MDQFSFFPCRFLLVPPSVPEKAQLERTRCHSYSSFPSQPSAAWPLSHTVRGDAAFSSPSALGRLSELLTSKHALS